MRQLQILRRTVVKSLAIIVACASCAHYVPPKEPPGLRTEVVVDRPFDNTWQQMIAFAGANLFGIETYEKESGLMTLSLNSSRLETYVNCGVISRGAREEQLTKLLRQPGIQTDFDVKINLVIQPKDSSQTSIKVNALYEVNSKINNWLIKMVMMWRFGSNESSDGTMTPFEDGKNVQCRSTGKIESTLLDGISGSSG